MTEDNIAKISALFPHCVSDVGGEDGNIRLKIDFELLSQELSGEIVEGRQERYEINWPGKRAAMLARSR